MAAKSYDWNALSQVWSQSMGSPTTQAKYKAGIMRQTVSPTALAATPEAEAKYLNNVSAAVASGKRSRALNAVTLQDHQQASINKGAPRLGPGAVASAPRWARAMAPYTQVYATIDARLANMPTGGFANAVARNAVAIEELMKAAGTY